MSENNEKQITPFGQTRSLMAVDPAAVAAGEAVKARIQAAYIMSYQKPRNIDQARAKILKMCKIPEFAEKVEYSKPIGGKKIKGLSIRAAEAFLALYENILSEAQLLFEDDNIKRIRISALDLEGNTQFSRDISIKKTVERKSKKNREDDYISERQNSYDDTVYLLRATEDEVMVKESAYVSKFIRTEGLRLIPADIKEEAVKTARAVLSMRDKEDPNAAKKRILDAFSGINIWPKDLEKYLKHSVDTISPAEIADLRTVYSAIESGEASWADYVNQKFEPPKAKAQTQGNETTDPQGEPQGDKSTTQTEEPTGPVTNPEFAAMVKKETGKDFEYVPSKDGVAHDFLSAYLESVGKNNNDATPFEMMEMVSAPGIFPGFWGGFINGTWKNHFDGKLPEQKKAESSTGSLNTEPENTEGQEEGDHQEGKSNPFDIDWDKNGLKGTGTERYWQNNKAGWDAASEAGKKSFEAKWLRVFTKDGVLTKPIPWMDAQEPDPEPENTREPGDDSGTENNQEGPIDYHKKLTEINTSDQPGLIAACEALGYGSQPVIPLSAKTGKLIYDKYLELKK